MAAVQPVPDDEIAAELASSWAAGDPAGPPPRPVRADRPPVAGRPAGSRRRPGDPPDLRRAAELVRPVSPAHERVLPLSPAFADLLPAGLPRGAVVAVSGAGAPWAGGSGAATVALALVASASAAGSWVALVGLPALGLAAAAGLGVALDRLVVIEPPPPEQRATVVAALVGAFDVVLVPPAPWVRPAEGRRLVARARERGTVLVPLGGAAVGGPAGRGGGADPLPADLRITVATAAWEGVGAGHGVLRRRRARVEVTGRGAAARARRAELWLPDGEGGVRPVEPAERGRGPAGRALGGGGRGGAG